jgi:hypothetical protein
MVWFLTHYIYRLACTSILTLSLGFPSDKSYLFGIRSAWIAFIWFVATEKPMWMHTSEFFLANRSHLMTPRKGLEFFDFWWISYARFGGRFNEIGRSLQNSKNTFEGLLNETRADMCIPGGLLLIWGVVLNFPFAVSVAASQKTWFRH